MISAFVQGKIETPLSQRKSPLAIRFCAAGLAQNNTWLRSVQRKKGLSSFALAWSPQHPNADIQKLSTFHIETRSTGTVHRLPTPRHAQNWQCATLPLKEIWNFQKLLSSNADECYTCDVWTQLNGKRPLNRCLRLDKLLPLCGRCETSDLNCRKRPAEIARDLTSWWHVIIVRIHEW